MNARVDPSEALAILHEFAADDPRYVDSYGDIDCPYCDMESDAVFIRRHADTCLWMRAKRLVEGGDA